MKIIVDTSRIIAALIRNSYSRTILLSDKFEFLTVNIAKFEIEEHTPEILEKAQITEGRV
jgi:predicted nucleic acid-binding protein